MSVPVNNNPDKVINELINAPSMKDSIQFQRTGFFKSRTVTVGGEPCSLDQLIKVLGEKIKNADVTKDEPNLEKLKEMLTAISDAEKVDRTGFSPLFHFFSSRDKEVDKLQHKVDVKIEEHKIYEKLLGGYTITLPKADKSDLRTNLITAIATAKPTLRDEKLDVRQGRIFIDFTPDTKDGEWMFGRKNATVQEVSFYIEEDQREHGQSTFVVALANEVKNGDVKITAEDVVNILKKKNI